MNRPSAEQVKAGKRVCKDMTGASVSWTMCGLGGSRTWKQFLATKPNNMDLIQLYIDKQMAAEEVIYLATRRAK